jgi:hypothetical protein
MNDHGFATMDVMGGFWAIWYESCLLERESLLSRRIRDRTKEGNPYLMLNGEANEKPSD